MSFRRLTVLGSLQSFKRIHKNVFKSTKTVQIDFSAIFDFISTMRSGPCSCQNHQQKIGNEYRTLNPILTCQKTNEWIVKNASAADKRTLLITLTVKSRKSKSSISKAILAEIAGCNLTGAHLTDLMKHLKALNKNIQRFENDR